MVATPIGLVGVVIFFKYNVLISLSFLCIASICIYTAVTPFYLCQPTSPLGLLNDLTHSKTPRLLFLSLSLLITGLICIFYCATQREGAIRA